MRMLRDFRLQYKPKPTAYMKAQLQQIKPEIQAFLQHIPQMLAKNYSSLLISFHVRNTVA